MGRMGHKLSPDETAELMAELDLDGSGLVEVNEFLDKVRQANNELAADRKRCRQLFDECDDDGSGSLDEQEMVYCMTHMGLAVQVQDPDFIKQMIVEINTLAKASEVSKDGEVRYEELVAWFLEIGATYLERPKYESSVNLEAPSDAELRTMFQKIDADGSGSVDFQEVEEALSEIWPYMDSDGFRRAFSAADDDESGVVEMEEFVELVKFTVWLNENRHKLEELEDAFGRRVSESEFHFGCQSLDFKGSDGDSKYLFERHCVKLGRDPIEQGMTFEQFVLWAVAYACVASTEEESEADRTARQNAIMSKELSNMAGEYGDVHFQDLASVLGRGAKGGDASGGTELQRRFKGWARSVIEMCQLIKRGIENSTVRNDSFPRLPDAILRKVMPMCVKEEYFSGQNIVTQGESDGTYYVLRRGRVEVIQENHGDEKAIGNLESGAGFGEIGLLLGTKRTATIKCLTPCDVYVLEKADYETVVALLPKDQRTGALAKVLQGFWSLVTNPVDGSRRESVDYRAYLAFHVRTSKTLTSNSEAEEFDEYEEREVAQSDWAEDCERYKLKVTDSLIKQQFFSSMYQLVELWSGDLSLSYDKFLGWILENIASWNEEAGHYTFRNVDDVQAVGDKFEQLKEDARVAEEEKKAMEEKVLAAAEEKRRLQEEEAGERARKTEQAKAKKKDALAKIRRMRAAIKVLGGEGASLKDRLTALEDEEAELLRRLAAGDLTPEEEAAIRARLAEIAAEKAGLQARLLDNQLQAEVAELNRKLAALDDEEAELLRRLAAGDLTPEEEAAIRARLAEIALEREALLAEKAAKTAAQLAAAGDVRDQKFAKMLAAIDSKLSALDDEEAELLRRLAAGDLTPEEEAAIRARLAEIAREREALLKERAGVVAARNAANAANEKMQHAAELAELHRKLSALDDEEAELLRRLAAGDLSPEEEAAIRKRLAEIAAEREVVSPLRNLPLLVVSRRLFLTDCLCLQLQAQLQKATLGSQLADIDAKLSALDDEEAELLRRLAAGGLTPEEEAAIRKRLAEIAAERGELLAAKEAALLELLASGNLTEEERAALEAKLKALDSAKAANELGMMKARLAALDDEEAELLRRLAAGVLTPEEEAAVRARLAEIARERKALAAVIAQAEISLQQHEMADLDAKLTALDDEEAELLRRLAAGDLTPEEAAAVRARLAAIDAERQEFQRLRHAAESSLAGPEQEERERKAAALRSVQLALRSVSAWQTAVKEVRVSELAAVRAAAAAKEAEADKTAVRLTRAHPEVVIHWFTPAGTFEQSDGCLRTHSRLGGPRLGSPRLGTPSIRVAETNTRSLGGSDRGTSRGTPRLGTPRAGLYPNWGTPRVGTRPPSSPVRPPSSPVRPSTVGLARLDTPQRYGANIAGTARPTVGNQGGASEAGACRPWHSELGGRSDRSVVVCRASDRGSSATRCGGPRGRWRVATCGDTMLAGQHYVEFRVERKTFGLVFGVIRPGWDIERDITGAHSMADGAANEHCLYYSLSGKRWPGNCAWDGMAPSNTGDRLGMLLDFDSGSMAIYKNSQWIGVMAAGLYGEYCWAVSLGADKDCVHMQQQPVPERTEQQLALTEATALAHVEAVAHAEAVVRLGRSLRSSISPRIRPEPWSLARSPWSRSSPESASLETFTSTWSPAADSRGETGLDERFERMSTHGVVLPVLRRAPELQPPGALIGARSPRRLEVASSVQGVAVVPSQLFTEPSEADLWDELGVRK